MTAEERALAESHYPLAGKAIEKLRASARGRMMIDLLGYDEAFAHGVLHICRIVRRNDPTRGKFSTLCVKAVMRRLMQVGERQLNWRKFAWTESGMEWGDGVPGLAGIIADDAAGEHGLEQSESVRLILAAIARLHPTHRDLLHWLAEGKRARDYALKLGVRHQRVHQILLRARDALRRELATAVRWAGDLLVDEKNDA